MPRSVKKSVVRSAKPGPVGLTGRANAVTRGSGRKLGLIKQSVAPVKGFQRGKPQSGPFVPGAKLDASQVTDKRRVTADTQKVRSLAANAAHKKMMRPKSGGGFDPGKFMGEVGRNVSGAAGNFGKGVNEVNKAIGAAGDTAFGGLRRASLNIPDGAQSARNNEALKRALGKKN